MFLAIQVEKIINIISPTYTVENYENILNFAFLFPSPSKTCHDCISLIFIVVSVSTLTAFFCLDCRKRDVVSKYQNKLSICQDTERALLT